MIDYIGKHKGEKALVCGCGPSLSQAGEHMPWDGPIILINGAYQIGIPAHYAFFIDRWGKHFWDIRNGEFVPFEFASPAPYFTGEKNGKLNMFMSGPVGISFAYQLGCSEICFLGIDGYRADAQGKAHFYDKKPTLKPGAQVNCDANYNGHKKCLSALIQGLRERGIKVTNLNKIRK